MVLRHIEDNIEEIGDYIGVDAGALYLASNHIHMKYAIGDFDSIKEDELDLVKEYSDNLIKLNPIKNDSDSEACLTYISDKYDELVIYGGIGGRLDHTLVNVRLLNKYPNKLIMKDKNNKSRVFSEGEYVIKKEEYKYISFFTFDKTTISLKGFKYSLNQTILTSNDLYTLSNEIVNDKGILTIHDGKLLVIQSRD